MDLSPEIGLQIAVGKVLYLALELGLMNCTFCPPHSQVLFCIQLFLLHGMKSSKL